MPYGYIGWGMPLAAATTAETTRFAGDPGVGKLRWGASNDPTTLETVCGFPLSVHRAYYTGAQVAGMKTDMLSDTAAGRMPWMSIKTPNDNWAEVASGAQDVWLTSIGNALASVSGPVLFTLHHEPEGDSAGTIAEWKAMQTHAAPFVRKPNVAFAPILTEYDTFNVPAYAFENYWVPGIWDVFGWDTYASYGTVKGGVENTNMTRVEASYRFSAMRAKADSAGGGIPVGVGEMGFTDEIYADKGNGWLTRTHAAALQYDISVLAYFNSSANSDGSWPLGSGIKRDEWVAAAQLPESVHN